MDWRQQLTKTQKRELRRISGLAHERELSVALSALEVQFGRWRAGEIEAHELNEAIHKFHQGPSHSLWLRYNDGDSVLVALGAIATGVVAQHEVAPDLMEILRPKLAVFE